MTVLYKTCSNMTVLYMTILYMTCAKGTSEMREKSFHLFAYDEAMLGNGFLCFARFKDFVAPTLVSV